WTTADDLLAAIHSTGILDVDEIKFYEVAKGGQSRGFVSVKLFSNCDAHRLLKVLPKKEVHGRRLVVRHFTSGNYWYFESQFQRAMEKSKLHLTKNHAFTPGITMNTLEEDYAAPIPVQIQQRISAPINLPSRATFPPFPPPPFPPPSLPSAGHSRHCVKFSEQYCSGNKIEMVKILLCAVGLVLLFEVYSVLGNDYKLVCYYTNWAHKRGDCKFLPEDINPKLCTHLIYAFAVIGNDHKIVAQQMEDEDLYVSFNDLKKRNPNLQTLLSIGGWNFGTEKFTAMVSSKESRLTFINSAIVFLRKKNFDGLDLHWEYPAFNRSPHQDKQRFTFLVQETLEEFKKESNQSTRPRLLLSAAVASGIRNIQAGYEIEKISEHLDFIGVMTYEFHGPWDPKTGPNSPLYKSSTDYNDDKYFNVEFAANYWKENGAPAEKLLVGFPTYGRTFTLCSPDNKPGTAACGPAAPGNCTKAAGILAYYEVEWLKNNSFGGAMVWTIDMDDTKGTFCNQGKTPLINKLKNMLSSNSKAEEDSSATTPLPSSAANNSRANSESSTACPNLEFCHDKNNGKYLVPCAVDSFYRCTNKTTDIENCPKVNLLVIDVCDIST
ncbi:hypothetical protein scyTo_0009949, partial [Scyliorhinus torazame]|nr:hypothetical protein [Scyliorhinus torazame]